MPQTTRGAAVPPTFSATLRHGMLNHAAMGQFVKLAPNGGSYCLTKRGVFCNAKIHRKYLGNLGTFELNIIYRILFGD